MLYKMDKNPLWNVFLNILVYVCVCARLFWVDYVSPDRLVYFLNLSLSLSCSLTHSIGVLADQWTHKMLSMQIGNNNNKFQ